MTKPLIVATGASGQLGQTLSALWPASPNPEFRFLALDRTTLDLGDPSSIREVLDELCPACIINAAAYTAVDKAESESKDAFMVNETAVEALAAWATENDALLLQISTDFVFDGSSSTAYSPDQDTSPLGVYGASKLAGEKKIKALAPNNSAIVRTSWLYSEYGGNFVKTMLRLMKERDELSVVNDQIGSPTSTHGLARLIFAMIRGGNMTGIYHWSDGASISWFEFAEEIQRQAVQAGILSKAIPIHPIATADYPTPARRPAYSVLDRSRTLKDFDCPKEDWKEQLTHVLRALAN